MRTAKAIAVVIVVSFAPNIFGQSGPTKDQQAVALMQASIAASGGAQVLASIHDFTASGTTVFNWNEATQAVSTITCRVPYQVRFDSTIGSATRSWAVSNGIGTFIDFGGSRTVLSLQTAYSLRTMGLPVLDFVAALSDGYSSITTVGLVSSDAGQAYQIHIQEQYPMAIDPLGTLSAALSRDYFLDPKTYLIIETKDKLTSDNPPARYDHSIVFSTFSNLNGVTLPMAMSEWVNGQLTWTWQLKSLTFNVGPPDSTFQP